MSKKDPLSYSDEDGQKAVIAAEITFYIAKFEALAPLVDAYALVMKHVGPHVRWYRTEAMTRPRKMAPSVYDFFATWFKPGTRLREEYEVTLTSGESEDLVGQWGFRFGVEPNLLPDIAGFFQLNLSREVLSDKPEEFRALALDLARLIEFRSGHAGYGVQYDEGDLDDERDERIGAWCRRYLCVNYRDFAATCEYMGKAIKGVSWLTFLDYDFVRALSGIEGLRKKLSSTMAVDDCKHGLALQAGPVPLLGDKNRREDLSAYREVFRVVEPLVVKEDLALPGFEDEASIDWVNRFA